MCTYNYFKKMKIMRERSETAGSVYLLLGAGLSWGREGPERWAVPIAPSQCHTCPPTPLPTPTTYCLCNAPAPPEAKMQVTLTSQHLCSLKHAAPWNQPWRGCGGTQRPPCLPLCPASSAPQLSKGQTLAGLKLTGQKHSIEKQTKQK